MTKPLHFLLADDDTDDRFFFDKALQKVSVIPTFLTTVADGEKLMNFLALNSDELPDALFLDLNMPRKNGAECLREIKKNAKWAGLPVIIYSTSLHEEVADVLYNNGAHYYIKKTDLVEMQKVLVHVIKLMTENKLSRPSRDLFILSSGSI